MADKEKIKCPLCKGCGVIRKPKKVRKRAVRVHLAKRLHDMGFSYREIMVFMGYKSTNSVTDLLKK